MDLILFNFLAKMKKRRTPSSHTIQPTCSWSITHDWYWYKNDYSEEQKAWKHVSPSFCPDWVDHTVFSWQIQWSRCGSWNSERKKQHQSQQISRSISSEIILFVSNCKFSYVLYVHIIGGNCFGKKYHETLQDNFSFFIGQKSGL